MEIVRILAGPLIGAVIGYLTNFIAVKMLFYPRREIRIFGHRLPLTPGAIPKGKPRLAAATGAVIENHLLTREDVEEKLLSQAAVDRVADLAVNALSGKIRDRLRAVAGLEEEAYQEKKAALCRKAAETIVQEAQESDLTDSLLREIADALREKAMGTAWRLLVNSTTIGSVMGPAKVRLDQMIDQRGAAYIAPILERELTGIDSGTGLELLERFGRDEEALREAVIRVYTQLVRDQAAGLLADFHIAQVVEDKINAMSVEEVERLVWNVLRRELNTIVNLGALIGLVIGLLNTLLR